MVRPNTDLFKNEKKEPPEEHVCVYTSLQSNTRCFKKLHSFKHQSVGV